MIHSHQKLKILKQNKQLDQKKKEFLLVVFYKLYNNLVVLMQY